MRPLTLTVPKPLCPVGNVALVDRALALLDRHGLADPTAVAVNVCYLPDVVADHVRGHAFISREPGPPALGTAGAVAHLSSWAAGRGLLVGNSDAYLAPRLPDTRDLAPLFDGWDGTTVRVLGVPAKDDSTTEFRPAGCGPMRFAGFSLLPADVVAGLPAGRSELVHEVWRPAERAGRLEVITYDGEYIDTGTPPDFLAANLHAAAGGSLVAADAEVSGLVHASVIGSGARVRGSVTRCVVFPGSAVGAGERLVDAIRLGSTVTVNA
jgi:NDP-sugar pyrophosphorylase family protein